MRHLDRIGLGRAGVVTYAIDASGVAFLNVTVNRGWHIGSRVPKRWWRWSTPSSTAAVVLHDKTGQEWELEINRLTDGTWECAVRQLWPGDGHVEVDTPGGRVRATVDPDGVTPTEIAPAPGWTLSDHSETGADVFISFDRGDDHWEAVIRPPMGRWPAQVEREHSHPLTLPPGS